MALPALTDCPQHYADCCLGLSVTVIDRLSTLLLRQVRTGLVLSIGSGTGLLEALLNRQLRRTTGCELVVEGVEVRSRSNRLNRYLSEELRNVVEGTWAVCPRVEMASALMFVYPRTASLLKTYFTRCHQQESHVATLIWLGPKADWPDFEHCFVLAGYGPPEIREGDGLAEYEMLVVSRRTP